MKTEKDKGWEHHQEKLEILKKTKKWNITNGWGKTKRKTNQKTVMLEY